MSDDEEFFLYASVMDFEACCRDFGFLEVWSLLKDSTKLQIVNIACQQCRADVQYDDGYFNEGANNND